MGRYKLWVNQGRVELTVVSLKFERYLQGRKTDGVLVLL